MAFGPGGGIPIASVKMEAEPSGLEKSLDVFRGKIQEVDGKFKDLGKNVNVAALNIKNMIDITRAASAVFRRLVRVVQDFLDKAIEASAEGKRLAFTLRSMGRGGAETAKEFQEYADQLQALTGISDESIISITRFFTTMDTLSNDTIKRAIRLSNDLSIAFGKDLNAAARALGTALEDPERGLRILRRAGIVLNETQRETVKTLSETGRAAEAATFILDVLERKIGGISENELTTFDGKIEDMKNALSDLQQVGGQVLVSFFGPATENLRLQIREMAKAEGHLAEIKKSWGEMGEAANQTLGSILQLIGQVNKGLGVMKETLRKDLGIGSITEKGTNPLGAIADFNIKAFNPIKQLQEVIKLQNKLGEIREKQGRLRVKTQSRADLGEDVRRRRAAADEAAKVAEAERIRQEEEEKKRLDAEKKAREKARKEREDEERRRREGLERDAEAIRRRSLSPVEKLREEYEKILALQKEGFLTQDQARKAVEKLKTDFMKIGNIEKKRDQSAEKVIGIRKRIAEIDKRIAFQREKALDFRAQTVGLADLQSRIATAARSRVTENPTVKNLQEQRKELIKQHREATKQRDELIKATKERRSFLWG